MMGTLIIVAILSIICIVCLTIIVYNQLLASNEVNRRLVVLTQEAIEHDRMTCEDLRNYIENFERNTPPSYDTNEEYTQETEDLNLDTF